MLGKRSYGFYEPKKFEAGSGSGSYKRPAYEKSSVPGQGQTQVQSSASAAGTVDKPGSGIKIICERCRGPHPVSECKWKIGACFSCGQVGHRVAQCKNPVLKTVFCYHCRQRGHIFSVCPERKAGNGGNSASSNPHVFALQYEEAPTVDTFAGTLFVASHPACALVDTGATHTCMSEEYMFACGLKPEVVSDNVMCVSTPLGSKSCMSRVVKDVNVVVEDHLCLLICL